jgi:hypothetical protein
MSEIQPGDIVQVNDENLYLCYDNIFESPPIVYRVESVSIQGTLRIGVKMDGWNHTRFNLLQKKQQL